jgi:hypothetical protein
MFTSQPLVSLAGLAFIVSAIALVGSGVFPLIYKLKEDQRA